METVHLNFDKFHYEANRYAKELAEQLGHPDEPERAMIVWRAVMHSIRDRIQISESLDLISQLPIMLKGIYVDQWKYHDKPPMQYETIEDMKNQVKELEKHYGETEFNWDESTEEIISRVLNSMKAYISEGQMEHIRNQLPREVKEVI